MNANYVLVADQARARLLRMDPGDRRELTEVRCFDHPEARIPRRELERRPPASTHDRLGAHRHSIEEHTPAHKREAIAFAHVLVAAVDELRRSNQLARWALIAPPEFLGELRAQLPDPLRALLVYELDSELTQLALPDLAQRIPPGIWTH